MKTLIVVFLCLLSLSAFSQKKAIDFSTFKDWPEVGYLAMSNDGRFVAYAINSINNGGKIILQETNNSWKVEIPKATSATFSTDGKFGFVKLSNDSLEILNLQNKVAEYLTTKDFNFLYRNDVDWLVYIPDDNPKALVLRNLQSGEKKQLNEVSDYLIANDHKDLLFQTKRKTDTAITDLIWYSISREKRDTICRSNGTFSNFTFDKTGEQLIFLNQRSIKGVQRSCLFYFKTGRDTAARLVDVKTNIGGNEYYINSNSYEFPRFNSDGAKIFISFENVVYSRKKIDSLAEVDIWSYKDSLLQSQQLINKSIPDIVASVDVNSKTNSIRLLARENEQLVGDGKNHMEDFVLVADNNGIQDESYWRKKSRKSYFLVDENTGGKKLIAKKLLNFTSTPTILPNNKFIIWYDAAQRNYFTYNIITGATRNVSKCIAFPLYNELDDSPDTKEPYGIVACYGENSVLIYDRYDIWLVDLNGIERPRNITNGYGRQSKTRFRYFNLIGNDDSLPVIDDNDRVFLYAFNEGNKYQGFYSIESIANRKVIQLFMGAVYGPGLPEKAKNADVYIWQYETPSQYGNIYSSTDLKIFNRLTDLKPQKNYNWYTSELIKWRLPGGTLAEGILYKPENFDASKKYPIIFNYYEKDDEFLYEFLKPTLSYGDLNKLWFLSHGYLVFVPNIYYKIGLTGQSAFNSVVSAAEYLTKFPWVNSRKMGLMGHSFGAFETNYIITKTNMFAAAASSSGVCDLVSLTFNLRYGDGESAEYVTETTQNRMGATLWQRPDLYIKNSPIYFADKVNTPLLMMHNKNDGSVPWSQGVEWFSALRRLNKPVWMLQYEGEGHGISTEKNQLDYSVRLAQFFDHYLKDTPMPKWMAEGVPANMKGIDSGLELEP